MSRWKNGKTRFLFEFRYVSSQFGLVFYTIKRFLSSNEAELFFVWRRKHFLSPQVVVRSSAFRHLKQLKTANETAQNASFFSIWSVPDTVKRAAWWKLKHDFCYHESRQERHRTAVLLAGCKEKNWGVVFLFPPDRTRIACFRLHLPCPRNITILHGGKWHFATH